MKQQNWCWRSFWSIWKKTKNSSVTAFTISHSKALSAKWFQNYLQLPRLQTQSPRTSHKEDRVQKLNVRDMETSSAFFTQGRSITFNIRNALSYLPAGNTTVLKETRTATTISLSASKLPLQVGVRNKLSVVAVQLILIIFHEIPIDLKFDDRFNKFDFPFIPWKLTCRLKWLHGYIHIKTLSTPKKENSKFTVAQCQHCRNIH